MVSHYFSPKKTNDLFSNHLKRLPVFTCHHVTAHIISSSLPYNIVCPVFFVSSATKKFISFGCQPTGWCHLYRSAPSDATGSICHTQRVSVPYLTHTGWQVCSRCVHIALRAKVDSHNACLCSSKAVLLFTKLSCEVFTHYKQCCYPKYFTI